jgi:hypothetical protein
MPGRDIGQSIERAAVFCVFALHADSRGFCMTQQAGNVPNHAE